MLTIASREIFLRGSQRSFAAGVESSETVEENSSAPAPLRSVSDSTRTLAVVAECTVPSGCNGDGAALFLVLAAGRGNKYDNHSDALSRFR